MARRKKTLRVAPLASRLQEALNARIPYGDDAVRSTLCFTIETVLHDSGNYRGYHYVDQNGNRTRCDIRPGQANYYRRRYHLPADGGGS